VSHTGDWRVQPSKVGVLLSGGSPNLHLIAGALCAFYEQYVSFDVIGASGAGALPGLLYAVPKGGNPVEALKATVHLNVSDTLYNLLPVNYKVFQKSGPFSQLFWQFGQMLPHFTLPPQERYHDSLKRLYNDWIDLVITTLTPTTLNYFSKSVSTRVDTIHNLVDWDALPSYPKEFYLNAFNLDSQNLELFDKSTLTPDSFFAALAMPWLYPPVSIQGRTYTEGASHDPSGLEALWQYSNTIKDLDTIIALDTVDSALWTVPRSSYDALQTAVMDPLVSLAEYVLGLYAKTENKFNPPNPRKSPQLPRLYRVQFGYPEWEVPNILDWSYANALTLWDIGYKAAMQPAKALYNSLQHPEEDANIQELEKYRYSSTLQHDMQGQSRTTTNALLTLCDLLLEQ
jgi:predicted acylesterase/phospholipase RssA